MSVSTNKVAAPFMYRWKSFPFTLTVPSLLNCSATSTVSPESPRTVSVLRPSVAATTAALLDAHTALFTRAREEGDLASGIEPGTAARALSGLALQLYTHLALGLPDADREHAHAGAQNFLDAIVR